MRYVLWGLGFRIGEGYELWDPNIVVGCPGCVGRDSLLFCLFNPPVGSVRATSDGGNRDCFEPERSLKSFCFNNELYCKNPGHAARGR